MIYRPLIILLSFLLVAPSIWANMNRVGSSNQLVWINNNHQLKTSKKTSAWVEYQWRRTNGLKDWQQSLLRVGGNYQLHPKFQIGMGYAWAESFPYGDFASKIDAPFPEHRLFQQLTSQDQIGRVALQHRARYEQRWLGKLSMANGSDPYVEQWNFLQRLRYQLHLTIPITNKTLLPNTFYASLYNEIFIGFGENVTNNIFDQNRTGLIAGYRISHKLRIESGYFHMILQQSNKSVAGKNIFQYNNGFIVSLISQW